MTDQLNVDLAGSGILQFPRHFKRPSSQMTESSTTASTTAPAPDTTASQLKDGHEDKKDPVVIICIGMAGSVSGGMLV